MPKVIHRDLLTLAAAIVRAPFALLSEMREFQLAGKRAEQEVKAAAAKAPLLKSLIHDIIAELGRPVSDDEQAQGWDFALKERWKEWFTALDQSIVKGEDIPAGWGIARSMDFDGVGRTPLCLRASAIGQLLDQRVRY